MAEPNADYYLQPLRDLWYRMDKSNFDAANEHALSHGKLFAEHGNDYDLDGVVYFGGIANYFLVLNYILRIPNSLKKLVATPFMLIEKLYHKLPGKLPYASFIACWRLR